MPSEGKDLAAIGREILYAARNELYLAFPYLDAALCALRFEAGNTLSLATDAETLYFDAHWIAERFMRSRTAIGRAYLHTLLHCMLRHPGKKRGRDGALWDVACDAAVESILDSLDRPCIAAPAPPEKLRFYNACRAELKVLTAEGIYRLLLRNPRPEYEIAQLQRAFLMDDHRLWDIWKRCPKRWTIS